MSIEHARVRIQNARSIAILTGAGVSAESGIPTFRGAAGLWRQFTAEDLATPQAFARNPELVWEWYDWRRTLIAKAKPNAAHEAISALERRTPNTRVVTQNVDGLHQAAGSKNVLEIHGSIWTLRCCTCNREWEDRQTPLTVPPRCRCGSITRPGVVWFGESLPRAVWDAAEGAVQSCDVLLVVGTSALVYPAAGLAPLARSRGAHVIEINIEPSSLSASVDHCFIGPAGEILPKLLSI